MPGSILASDSSKPYTGPSVISGASGIKLTTVTTVKEVDDASSSRRLTDPDLEHGSRHSNDYEQPLGGGYHGPQTVISGRTDDVPPVPERKIQRSMGGIHVKNEMSISYEQA